MDLKKLALNFENKVRDFFNAHKTIIFWTVVFTVFTHIYFFMGRYGNEDSRFYINETVSIFSSGRYFYGHTKFDFVPIIIFLLHIVELIFSVLAVLSMFRIKSKLYSIIIAAIMVTFPVLGYSFSYIQMYDTYTLALLFSVLAVYCADRWKYGFFGGGVLLACGLALYQAYIEVSMGFCMVILIIEFIENDMRDVFIKALRFAALIIIGFIVYRAGIWILGIELSNYAGIDSMGVIPISEIPARVIKAYSDFYGFFTAIDFSVPSMSFFYIPIPVFVVYVIFALFSLRIILKAIKESKVKLINKAVIVIVFLLMPFILNFMGFAALSIHCCMMYSFVIPFIIPFIFMDRYFMDKDVNKKTYSGNKCFWVKRVMVVLSAIIIGYNFWTTNLLYFKLDVLKTNTVSFFTRMYSRFEQLEGFTDKTPIAFIVDGKEFLDKSVNQSYAVFPNTKTLLMIRYNVISGFAEGTHKPPYYATFKNSDFLKNLLGIIIPRASTEQIEEIMKTDEYKSMGVYPDYDSVKMINGIAVANFIDNGNDG